MTFNLEKYTEWQAMLRRRNLPKKTRLINGVRYTFWIYIAERREGQAIAKHGVRGYDIVYQPLKFGGWLWRRKT